MDPVLAQIDVLLEDEELYQRVRSDFAKRYPKTAVTGRKSTPVEVMLRQFCRVYFEDVLGDAVSLRIEGASNAPTERWWRAALMHPVIVIGWQTASEAGSDNRARKTGRQVRRLVVRQKEAAQQAYTITQQRASQAKQVLEALGESSHPQAQGLKDTLETFIPRAEQVIGQTIRRVFQDEKIVSIFEAHTAIIGEARQGSRSSMAAKSGLTKSKVALSPAGRCSMEPPATRTNRFRAQLFGKPPTQASADRSVFSADNEAEAKRRDIQRVVLPKPGKKSEKRRQYQKQPWFRRARKWHAGVEGRISVLKRCYDLDRCLNHGEDGFQRWVAWGVIAHNLKKIGATVAY